jgi:hypothetical protein
MGGEEPEWRWESEEGRQAMITVDLDLGGFVAEGIIGVFGEHC